ncbi:PLDc N-terminal domain-containing protein [Streptomyces sp. TS71-3]|uniref:PLDc N-terminal domain-containing protein n=1 Tax=Streptomyces sp. TS71-3 TaxID=2733862 RepID=UPI001BB321B3|nr:PLDc N-terminal domain-containing protein [Streptomyces sp. TS71-3]
MHSGLSIFAAVLLIAVMVAYVLFIIGAFVSILRSRFSAGMKFVWCVFVVIAPFLGSLLWFLIGKGYSERQVRAY